MNVNDAVKASAVDAVIKGNKGDFAKFYNQFDILEVLSFHGLAFISGY